MEIVNKNSYNHAVLHKLKIRQNNWRPSSPFPLVLWPYYATRVCYAEKYFVRHTHYENWIVCCVEKGCLQVICQGEVYNVRAGETILIPPGPHTFAAEEGETLQSEGTLRSADRNNQGICDVSYYAMLKSER